MKLITLNIWGGHVKKPLLDFILQHQETDVFCLQEVYQQGRVKTSDDDRMVHLNIFGEIKDLLPNHRAFFRPAVGDSYGIGMLIKNSIDVLDEGEIGIYENPNYSGMGGHHSRILQWAKCQVDGIVYSVLNVHGLWNGKGKTDTPDRILQSQRIRGFIDGLETPIVLCGDFNLRPDTESVKILEEGMKNLVALHHVTSTRTRFYPKEEKFADYIFTSPNINVRHFEVMKDEVSDHSPLLLNFTVGSRC